MVDARTLQGKALAIMQAWHYVPTDGAGQGWSHWFRGEPSAENALFDLWPDVREFGDDELQDTGLTYPDGRPAKLFSSYNPKTAARHFRWLRDAGIDGASLGRFVAGTTDPTTRARLDRVLDNVRCGAEASGRVFFVWTDVSGSNLATLAADLQADFLHLQTLGVFDSPSYLRPRGGKPLVGYWGAGDTAMPGPQDGWQTFLTWLKPQATVLLSGPRTWAADPIIAQADVVSPWAVMAFGDDAGADVYRRDVLERDLALTRTRGQEYFPLAWPGFSWRNLQQAGTINAVPRRGGRFIWRQLYNNIASGATCLGIAMMDETDEGTAIFKAAETQRDVPAQGAFLSLDADGERLSSDFFLRLAGAAGCMLRREIPLTVEIPITKEKRMKVIDGYVLEAGSKKPVVPAYIQLIAQSGTHVDARSNIKDGSGYFNIGFEDQAITFLVLADGYAMKTGFVGDPQDGVTYDGGRLVVEVTPAGLPFDQDEQGYLTAPRIDPKSCEVAQFRKENGTPWLFAGYTMHMLINRVARGEDIQPILARVKALGYNTIVSIGCHLSPWKVQNGFAYDPRQADHPKRLARLYDIVAEMKMRLNHRSLADAQGLSYAVQEQIWLKDCAVAKDRWNAMPAVANEDKENGVDASRFPLPDIGRCLASRGSRGGNTPPHTNFMHFAEWEPRRDPVYKSFDDSGAGVRELQFGYNEYPGGVPVPIVVIEPAFYNDTNPDKWGDERWTDPKRAFAIGVNIAANSAGGGFGSTEGLEASPDGPVAFTCAQQFAKGMWRGFLR